ncbi:MAG: hypothetical protein JWL87_186 [Candidatus Adlerbacteria bacterium]|nr:hypothetical protein [Candidatus Adlerbacteria bacterium]
MKYLVLALIIVVLGGLWILFSQGVISMPQNPMDQTATTTPATTGQNPGTAQPGAATGGQTTAPGSGTATGLKSFSTPFGFSFQYPGTMTLQTTGLAAGSFKAPGAVGVAALYAQMGTVVDRLTLSVSSEPADVGDCAKQTTTSSTATINGAIFTKYASSATAEGQLTNTTTYQIKQNQACFEIRDVVTTSDIAKLSASEVAQQKANVDAAAALMGTIVASYRLTY